jgi:Ca-activated chloride channel family protein
MERDINFYALLDVCYDATEEEIRGAYHLAARRYHPDSNQGLGTPELFYRVQKAYDTLSSNTLRMEYDQTLADEDLTFPGFSQRAFISKTKIPPSSDPQLIYVLLDIGAKSRSNKPVQHPLNLTLVLDRSKSMTGERMDMVKENAIQLLRQLSENDIISIVTFSDRAEILITPSRLSDLHLIESKISRIQTTGSTEIFQGLSAGIAQVRQNHIPGYINHLILFTDGRTYGDEEQCLELGREAAEEGIGISGLGIGSEWNDEFIDALAACAGGESMYISGTKDLKKFLDQKYRNLEQIYGEQVNLDFSSSPECELQYAFRIYPEPAPLNTVIPVRSGNLHITNKLVLLLEFRIKPTDMLEKEITLMDGYVTLHIPTRKVPRTRLPINLNCSLTKVIDSNQGMPAPIVHALSQLTLYRMQEKAQDELKKGETVKASRHLQYLATHLISKGERELANTVLKEADNIQNKKGYSKEGDKRIKYGTRSLLLPSGTENK